MIAGSPILLLHRPSLHQSKACCVAKQPSSWATVSPGFSTPQFFRRTLLRWLLLFITAALAIGGIGVQAEEGGKEVLQEKLDTFTVNLLGSTQRCIQVDITLSLAKAQSAEKIKLYMPVIRHNMILLLSNQEAGRLETNAGKLELMREARSAANNAINLTEKEGVADVYFTSFVMQ